MPQFVTVDNSVGGAIVTLYNTVLSFSRTNNFINNSAIWGGAIYTSNNTVLISAEPTTSSTIQQMVVVQFTQNTVLYLASLELATLSITQHLWAKLS